MLTTVTPTGRARAQALFGARVDVRYVPIDLPGSVRRFFQRVQPRLAVILETEIWPNLYHRCGHLGVPLVLASARISPRSVKSYRRLVGLFRETLSHGIFIAAQSAEDAERFRSIGANPERTHVVGNIKFDFGYPADIEARGHELRRLLGVRSPGVGRGQHACARRRHRCSPRIALLRAALLATRCWCWCRGIRRASAKWRTALRDQGVPFVTRTSGSAVSADTRGVPGRHARRTAGVLCRR